MMCSRRDNLTKLSAESRKDPLYSTSTARAPLPLWKDTASVARNVHDKIAEGNIQSVRNKLRSTIQRLPYVMPQAFLPDLGGRLGDSLIPVWDHSRKTVAVNFKTYLILPTY